jgi:hypothetical protein
MRRSAATPRRMSSGLSMVKIFISYRRDDSAYVAAAINERLSDRFGSDAVFFDIDKIPLGRDFRTYIADQVGQCNVVLAVIADQWLTTSPAGARRLDAPTDYVRVELESALAHGKTVVPVLVGNAEMPSADELPESLKDLPFLNAAEVRPGRDLAAHIERLLEGVVSIVQPEAGPEPKPSVPSPRAAKHARSSHPGPRTVLQRTLPRSCGSRSS